MGGVWNEKVAEDWMNEERKLNRRKQRAEETRITRMHTNQAA
jgi:hypothetical protein